MLVRVVVSVFLWRPRSTVHPLPDTELHGGISGSRRQSKHQLLGKFTPKIRHPENFLEEYVILGAGLGPLVELVHNRDVVGKVA